MKSFTCLVAAATLIVAGPAAAQSVFDGTWKVDTSKDEFGGKPLSRMLKDGSYECRSCAVPYTVAADGAAHAVAGQPYFDAASIKVVDDRTIGFEWRKGDKLMETATEQVSADGRTLTYSGTDLSAANGTPVTYQGTRARVGALPTGAHAVSGEWRNQRGATVSDAGLSLMVKTIGDSITVTQPTGETYTATLDGPEVPIQGDAAATMIKVGRAGPRALTFASSRGGEAISSGRLTVAADGRTATYDARGLKTGTTNRFVVIRQ